MDVDSNGKKSEEKAPADSKTASSSASNDGLRTADYAAAPESEQAIDVNFVPPSDWPKDGEIDLSVQDLPHDSSDTEWWYVNGHLTAPETGQQYSFFASFFRISKDKRRRTESSDTHLHALNWAIVDAHNNKYHGDPILDPSTPTFLKDQLVDGSYKVDPRLQRAFIEVLEKGAVPLPDRLFTAPTTVALDKLALDFGGNTFHKDSKGHYHMHTENKAKGVGLDLKFVPKKTPQRQGHNGVVKVGLKRDTMFYYFIPRNEVTGTATVEGKTFQITGTGWYDHEFGGLKNRPETEEKGGEKKPAYAWNWLSVQLDDGTDITATVLVEPKKKLMFDNYAVAVEKDSTRTEYLTANFEGRDVWTSTRTMQDYPTWWTLTIPDCDTKLECKAAFAEQEFITLISRPAFWEGRVTVSGTYKGRAVTGFGFLERHGFQNVDSLDNFFKRVSAQVCGVIENMLPLEPTYEQVRVLMADEEHNRFMSGVSVETFRDTIIKPIREIVDRGGKSWRSFALLLCIDCVGGDSQRYKHWLAMPEIMHVGSLIVDDIQDKSDTRRGGPSCHKMYGDAIAINAGNAAYFLSLHMLQVMTPWMSDAHRLRLYEIYFLALRAGHGGQAFDINGLDGLMEKVLESGEGHVLETAVEGTHRLKSGVPAGCLARMGSILGGAPMDTVRKIETYFEQIGVAFQIIDDVLNLKGLPGKTRGEDITAGKITFPVAKAMTLMNKKQRKSIWNQIKSKPEDKKVIENVIEQLEECGAIKASEDQANGIVAAAWSELDKCIPDSFHKLLLRAFGWYVLERHY